MSRLGQAPGSEEFLEAYVAPGRGWVPNVYKALAFNRKLTRAWAGLGDAVRDHGLEPRRRELVILLVSRLKESDYEWAHHLEAAPGVGIKQREIADLRAWPARGDWSPTEWAMLHLASAVAAHVEVPDWAVGEVRAAWGDSAYVEICATSAYYVSVAHLIAALGVELESTPSDAGSTGAH